MDNQIHDIIHNSTTQKTFVQSMTYTNRSQKPQGQLLLLEEKDYFPSRNNVTNIVDPRNNQDHRQQWK